MRKLTDFQIDSRRLSDLENEVTAARGHEASLKERIDGILADFRVDQAGFTEGHIVINVQPGLAYINDSTIYHSAPLVHLIQTPAANTEYYIYLDSSGGLSSTTEPATDADRLPLAIVRTGDTVEDISVTDVRPLLQKGGAAKEVQEARGNYASLGARINSLETVVRSYSFSETHIATEGQQVFALEHTYPLGADKLRVYVGGVLQDPGPEDDYVEADERTVTFNYPLPAGTVVRFVVENLVREAGFVEVYEAQPGQQEFRLAHPYPVGINRLRVYVNGLLYEPGADNDYVEIDEYTVTFNDPFNGGERVKFVLEDVSPDSIRASGGYSSIAQRLNSQLGDCNVDIVIEYDEQNRPVREVWTGDVNKTIEYAYNEQGYRASEVVTEGNLVITTTYTYNAAGLITGTSVRKQLGTG